MPNSIKILLIDHEERDMELLECMLRDGYIVSSLDDSDSVIKRATCIHPEVVILNPAMPELPVKALCDELKSLNPPSCLLFLSSEKTMESCSDAYANGADDFILKPFNPVEVHEKIQVLTHNVEVRKKLVAASDTARIAIENSFELGTLITFMEAIGVCEDYDELSIAFFNAIADFGISVSLQIRGGGGALNFRCANDSLEAAILGEYQGDARIIEQPDRIVLHHNNISVLLKDLSGCDSMKYGRLKDHLSIMVNSAGARIISLGLQMELEGKRESGVEEALIKTSSIKDRFKKAYVSHQKTTEARMASFGQKMESVVFTLSLDYQQEEMLLNSLHALLVEFSDATELQTLLNDNLDELLLDMSRLLSD